jgi:prepilin-type N-terminal cleavage/methylation domain-containing protein
MSRPATPESGFTLLECVVATLVLTLLVLGLSSLTVAHDRLLAGLGTWAQGDPVLFVVPPRETLAALGAPALTSVDPPALPPPAPEGDLQVSIEEVTRGLQPAFVTAHAHVEDP